MKKYTTEFVTVVGGSKISQRHDVEADNLDHAREKFTVLGYQWLDKVGGARRKKMPVKRVVTTKTTL